MINNFFQSDTLTEVQTQQFSGAFGANLKGEECQLKLRTKANKVVTGQLNCVGQCFEFKGKLSLKSQTYYGFLIDPIDQLPFAYVKAKLRQNDLALELALADFEELFETLETESFAFQKRQKADFELTSSRF